MINFLLLNKYSRTTAYPSAILVSNLFLAALFFSNVAFANKNITLNPLISHDEKIQYFDYNFHQLPEKYINVNKETKVYALYAKPTTQYSHGILGDDIEAKQLVVLNKGTIYTHTLSNNYVYEDIKPRLYDVDKDGQLEIITIRTHVDDGAGIMIYKIENNALTEYAWVKEIGLSNRWLNIAAIYDLDGDGTTELAWIQTPHIGGILKGAKIQRGELKVLDETTYYSNHVVGDRNLCLSVVTKIDNTVTLYVPTQDRRQIVGFQFKGHSFKKTKSISKRVDFSTSLESQHQFNNIVQGANNCEKP